MSRREADRLLRKPSLADSLLERDARLDAGELGRGTDKELDVRSVMVVGEAEAGTWECLLGRLLKAAS